MKESMWRRRASGSWGRRAHCALMKEADEEADEEAKEADEEAKARWTLIGGFVFGMLSGGTYFEVVGVEAKAYLVCIGGFVLPSGGGERSIAVGVGVSGPTSARHALVSPTSLTPRPCCPCHLR